MRNPTSLHASTASTIFKKGSNVLQNLSQAATQKEDQIFFKTDYRLMQVESIAEWEHSVILSTFIKLPFVINIFVLSILEWSNETGFTGVEHRKKCIAINETF